MLPFLETPIDNESLQQCVAAPLMDRKRSISVCAAEALPMDYFQEPKSVALLKQSFIDSPGLEELIVEIDACDLIRDVNEAKRIARRLKGCGISTSIDDMTSEWHALVGISDFPFAELKVDRKLIEGCADDQLKRSACGKIMDFAHKFKVRTVAEGIERRSDFFAACELGFDIVQGFMFGKPMSVREFAANISQSSPPVPMLSSVMSRRNY